MADMRESRDIQSLQPCILLPDALIQGVDLSNKFHGRLPTLADGVYFLNGLLSGLQVISIHLEQKNSAVAANNDEDDDNNKCFVLYLNMHY